MSFTLYPAIDVRSAGVVRLRQGDYAHETRYAEGPLELASRYAQAGARWLHLVDLDAARSGRYRLHCLLCDIAERSRLRVQTGGGVRSADDVQELLDTGAQRAVVGSLAIRDPAQVFAWLDRFGPERIVIALDARRDAAGRWCLPLHGWTEASDAELCALLERYAAAGARHVLCTDIARDGMLGGPNIELYTMLRTRFPTLSIQASGGIRNAADIEQLRRIGCAGAITGKALLDGTLTLAQALAC